MQICKSSALPLGTPRGRRSKTQSWRSFWMIIPSRNVARRVPATWWRAVLLHGYARGAKQLFVN